MTALQGTAIVVGVGSEQGLGAALSRRFAREGYNVIVSGRTEAKLARVVRTIIDDGGNAEAAVVDATLEADVIALFDRVDTDSADRLDLVVFNAGNNAPTISAPCPRSSLSRRGASPLSAGFWSDEKRLAAWRRVVGARLFLQAPAQVYAGVRRLPHSHRPKRNCGRFRNRWRGNLDRLEFTSAMWSSMAVLTAKG
jgi:NAD(P)-dependent dehydrogenase (short-subunit alcohol dehydrogenase family)